MATRTGSRRRDRRASGSSAARRPPRCSTGRFGQRTSHDRRVDLVQEDDQRCVSSALHRRCPHHLQHVPEVTLRLPAAARTEDEVDVTGADESACERRLPRSGGPLNRMPRSTSPQPVFPAFQSARSVANSRQQSPASSRPLEVVRRRPGDITQLRSYSAPHQLDCPRDRACHGGGRPR